MLGYLANKALICGLIWSGSWCLSLCLESMATGPSSQHMGIKLEYKFCEKISDKEKGALSLYESCVFFRYKFLIMLLHVRFHSVSHR